MSDGGLDGGLTIQDAGAELDAYTPPATADSGIAPDANLPEVESMSAFEREEAAKDEVDAARAAIAAGQLDEARGALARARAAGARRVDLTSRPTREAANRLYRRLGFVPRETNVYRYRFE